VVFVVFSEMENGFLLVVMLNIGFVSMAGNWIIYLYVLFEYFVEFVVYVWNFGVCVIGGCCGMMLMEIAVIVLVVKEEC